MLQVCVAGGIDEWDVASAQHFSHLRGHIVGDQDRRHLELLELMDYRSEGCAPQAPLDLGHVGDLLMAKFDAQQRIRAPWALSRLPDCLNSKPLIAKRFRRFCQESPLTISSIGVH